MTERTRKKLLACSDDLLELAQDLEAEGHESAGEIRQFSDQLAETK